MVSDQLIGLIVGVGCYEVTVQQRPIPYHLLGLSLEVLHHPLVQQLLKPLSVFTAHKTVLKHTTAFMVPQTQQVRECLGKGGGGDEGVRKGGREGGREGGWQPDRTPNQYSNSTERERESESTALG